MTERERQRRMQTSVFGKLVVVMVLMAASLLLMVSGFFALVISPALTTSTERVVQEYARAVAASPPNFDAAKLIAARSDVQVRYEGPDGGWTTSPRVPTRNMLSADKHKDPWRHLLGARGDYLVRAPSGGTYIFSWYLLRQTGAAHLALFALLLFLMIAVVLTAHAVLRRQLRPLRDLTDGVARLGEGQLDLVLSNRSRDEFGALTDAFNRMVRRVRDMVHARDQLLLDVSHELRSPLTRMKVALALMPEDVNRAGMAADLAEMESMVTELLELERLRDGRGIRTARQDLLPILRELTESLRDKQPGIRVLVTSPGLQLDIDKQKIRIVLRNLLENAIKYSRPDSRPIEVTAMQTDKAGIVRVTDDGPGIPEGDLASLFEPFFRVDRSRSKKTGGYGLGLSICKRIMEAHGGSIAVENNVGRGASFILTFPAVGADSIGLAPVSQDAC